MSLTAAILFRSPPPYFAGTVTTYSMDRINNRWPSINPARQRPREQLVKDIFKSIERGNNTVRTIAFDLNLSVDPIQKTLLTLIGNGAVIRHGKPSTGYTYEVNKQ
ncbi:hypothetical protein GBK02_09050 [Dechloromonas sp. TW-R-39-2]|uniref:hypothetical protein n=1 Tax=Dechloromonas sp. TW-R-39-2 TaxID=2654218 RepID=UPI00193DE9E3|nr:hypothetical protein [Dechloromonas sp. TW-R-39-2]QRM19537.1 hypothetical protein GBK02_09050 [Dechloromonas sp. TW-R-39-2]